MAKFIGNGNDNIINGSLGDDLIFGKGGQDELYGLDGNDKINGGIGADYLSGGIGDDILIGGKGNDTMDGGDGADQFKGGQGSDTVDYSTSLTGVLAYLHTNTSLYGAAGDSYVNVENVIGSAYGDYLQNSGGGDAFGGAGNDALYGGGTKFSTEDGGRIRGDVGYDTLNMEYGNTTAWLQNGQGYDTIDDFIEGQDNFFIDLSDFGLGNTLDAGEIVNNNTHTAVGGNAQFIYDGDDGYLYFDSNGSAAGGQSLVAAFTNHTINGGNLDVGDFEFQV